MGEDQEEDVESQILDTIMKVENVLAGVLKGTISQAETLRNLFAGLTNMRGVLSTTMSDSDFTNLEAMDAESLIKKHVSGQRVNRQSQAEAPVQALSSMNGK